MLRRFVARMQMRLVVRLALVQIHSRAQRAPVVPRARDTECHRRGAGHQAVRRWLGAPYRSNRWQDFGRTRRQRNRVPVRTGPRAQIPRASQHRHALPDRRERCWEALSQTAVPSQESHHVLPCVQDRRTAHVPAHPGLGRWPRSECHPDEFRQQAQLQQSRRAPHQWRTLLTERGLDGVAGA